MANIVITSSTDRIYIDFGVLSGQGGLTSGDWQKDSCSAFANIGNTDVFFVVDGLHQWRFSYNGSAGSLQVDTVDGALPSSNTDLLSKINTVLAVQTIPDQTGNSGKYLTTDGSTMSWSTVTGGSGLQQYQIRQLIRR